MRKRPSMEFLEQILPPIAPHIQMPERSSSFEEEIDDIVQPFSAPPLAVNRSPNPFVSPALSEPPRPKFEFVPSRNRLDLLQEEIDFANHRHEVCGSSAMEALIVPSSANSISPKHMSFDSLNDHDVTQSSSSLAEDVEGIQAVHSSHPSLYQFTEFSEGDKNANPSRSMSVDALNSSHTICIDPQVMNMGSEPRFYEPTSSDIDLNANSYVPAMEYSLVRENDSTSDSEDEEIPRSGGVHSPTNHELIYDRVGNDSELSDSPENDEKQALQAILDRSRTSGTDLPSIKEESDLVLDSHSSNKPNPNSSDIPEPENLAPGAVIHSATCPALDDNSKNGGYRHFAQPLHRRVQSSPDEYNLLRTADLGYSECVSSSSSPKISNTSDHEVMLRNCVGRSSSSASRCASLVVSNRPERESEPHASLAMQRSMSNSDSKLNEEKEHEEAEHVPPVAPPPTVVHRKNSYHVKPQADSWQKYVPIHAGTAHSLVTPTTAKLTRSTSRATGSSHSTSATGSVADSNRSPVECVSSESTSPVAANPFPRPLSRTASTSSASSLLRASLRLLTRKTSISSVISFDEEEEEIQKKKPSSPAPIHRRATTPHRKKSRVKTRAAKPIEKKKDKSASETFSFLGGLFTGTNKGKRQKNRPSLDTVINNYGNSTPSPPIASTFPSQRSTSARGGIPFFADEFVFGPAGTVTDQNECYITPGFLDSLESNRATSRSPNKPRCTSATEHTSISDMSRWSFRLKPRRLGRRSSFVEKQYSAERSSIPDVVALNLLKWIKAQRRQLHRTSCGSDLPDNISQVFSGSNSPDEDADKIDIISSLQNTPKFIKLGLFSREDYKNWHDKYKHDKMTKKAVKKQDAIYELILLEKQHCECLSFLQLGYRQRLLQEGVVSETEVNQLVPDCLDSLLQFHCNLLEQLLSRQKGKDEVDTISDILIKEMSDDGDLTKVCVDAYTQFASSKERCEYTYGQMLRNSRFNEFMKRVKKEPLYREYDFKTLLTKIIGRPARYGLLLNTIIDNETKFTPAYDLTEQALTVVKRFAFRIDNNLLIAQLAKKWEDVRSQFELSSQTTVWLPSKEVPGSYLSIKWNIDDICSTMSDVGRNLQCIGEVYVSASQQGNQTPRMPSTMALFDDILVILRRNGAKYIFHSPEQSVVPVSSLIVRQQARGNSVILMSAGVKPSMFVLDFHSRSDMSKWWKMLEASIHAANRNGNISVRLSPRCAVEVERQGRDLRDVQEKKQREEEEKWFDQLANMFENRNGQENALADYISGRLKFVDEVREFLEKLPLRGRPELADRLKDALRVRFRELRVARTVPLNALIADMTRMKETEMFSYFDDIQDAAEVDSDGSCSDSSGSGGRQAPRRIKTFSGCTATTSSSTKKSNLRRHTTVPRMCSEGDEQGLGSGSGEDERREEEAVDGQLRRLPLTRSIRSRQDFEKVLHDCERLKTENQQMKNQLALSQIQIAALEKTRNVPATSLPSHNETMETLRRMEREVREAQATQRMWQAEFEHKQTEFEERVRQFEAEVARKQAQLERSEAELQEKWARSSQQTPQNLSEELSPAPAARFDTTPRISMNLGSRSSSIAQVFPQQLISETEARKLSKSKK